MGGGSARLQTCASDTHHISVRPELMGIGKTRKARFASTHPTVPNPPERFSPLPLPEMPQIRRRLVLARRHQQPIGTQPVVFLADDDIDVALAATRLDPFRTRI